MNEEILAELRRLRQTAEAEEKQLHWRAIGGHATRFLLLFAAWKISPDSPELKVLALGSGLVWVVMFFVHFFALMPDRAYDPPTPPSRPIPPPSTR